MKPKPLASLNHFTVPVAIQSTFAFSAFDHRIGGWSHLCAGVDKLDLFKIESEVEFAASRNVERTSRLHAPRNPCGSARGGGRRGLGAREHRVEPGEDLSD